MPPARWTNRPSEPHRLPGQAREFQTHVHLDTKRLLHALGGGSWSSPRSSWSNSRNASATGCHARQCVADCLVQLAVPARCRRNRMSLQASQTDAGIRPTDCSLAKIAQPRQNPTTDSSVAATVIIPTSTHDTGGAPR
jgi:hypothetical protein